MNYQEETNQLPYGLQTAVTAFSAIYSLGSTTWKLLKLTTTTITTITFCDWTFAVGSVALAIATFVLCVLNTIND